MKVLDCHRLTFDCADWHESTVIGNDRHSWMIIQGEAHRARDGMAILAGMRPREFDSSGEWVGACMGRASGQGLRLPAGPRRGLRVHYSLRREIGQGQNGVFLSFNVNKRQSRT